MASQTIDAFLDRVPYPIPKGLIVIGMSGGVNSSVTAALLKAKGCDEESVVRAAPSASGSVTLAVLIFLLLLAWDVSEWALRAFFCFHVQRRAATVAVRAFCFYPLQFIINSR